MNSTGMKALLDHPKVGTIEQAGDHWEFVRNVYNNYTPDEIAEWEAKQARHNASRGLRKKDKGNPANWVRDNPELGTRPKAIAAMYDNPAFRRVIHRHVQHIQAVASRMAGHPFAEEAIRAIFARRIDHFTKNYASEDGAVYSECHGFIHNVMKNAVWRETGRKPLGWNAHDVPRTTSL